LDSYEETDKEGVEKITDKSKDLKDNIFWYIKIKTWIKDCQN
jgi:hypothetical protein